MRSTLHAREGLQLISRVFVAFPFICPPISTLNPPHSLQPAEEQQLYRGEAVLEDGQSLAELGVQNDDELGLAYRLPDGGCT